MVTGLWRLPVCMTSDLADMLPMISCFRRDPWCFRCRLRLVAGFDGLSLAGGSEVAILSVLQMNKLGSDKNLAKHTLIASIHREDGSKLKPDSSLLAL